MTTNTNTKRALLIGINKYKRRYIRDLQGCVNDVSLMKNVLTTKFNFKEQNIISLTDEQATSHAIRNAFDQLISITQPNDIVVLHYSGHGSQITDQEGDEPDGLDETILPHDTGRSSYGHKNRDITDDHIFGLIKHLNTKTPYVTLIFDCCHSGTMSRDPFGDADRWAEPDNPQPSDPHYHLLPPAYNNSPVIAQLKAAQEADRDSNNQSGWFPPGEGYVLIAGCRDEEKSFERRLPGTDTRHGLLTYYLCQELLEAEPNTSYRSIFEQAAAEVTRRQANQHPQMEGKRNRQLFGTATIQTMRYLTVDSRHNQQITLRGGAAHGLTKGSQWAIYAAQTNEVTPQTPRLGLIQITDVKAVTATATILTSQSSQPEAVIGGCRAIEHAHNYGTMQLPIKFDMLDNNFTPDALKIQQWIQDSQLLYLTENPHEAQWNLLLLPPRPKITQNTRVPQLGPLDETMWVVINSDGQIQPAHPAANPESKYTIFENLEKSARYNMALNKINNPNPHNTLHHTVNVTFKRQNSNNQWIDATSEDKPLTYQQGEYLGLVIENIAQQPTKTVFISILNFGLTGAIHLLHPIEGASEELKPGHKIEIGIRDDDLIPVSIPANFPHHKQQGVDRLKLFITSQPADFSTFVQDGWRNITERTSGDSPLEQLMALALTNQKRDTLRGRPQSIDHWLTQTYEYIIKR